MLDLIFNNFTADNTHKKGFFYKIIKTALKELGLEGKNIELSINLVGERRIRVLNKKYRGKNRATDVLAFPLNGQQAGELLKQKIITLGDIFICLPFAKKQAKRENISIDSKLARLTVHGFLHLLGYDHDKSKKEEQKMFGLEKEIIDKVQVIRYQKSK